MIRKLSGTTAVITSPTSGIGRETALEFARAGANVVIAGRRADTKCRQRSSSLRVFRRAPLAKSCGAN
jgi:NAD(P)-dependent dehydrogenase (short-subunit alcohol dehydrogenase family)